MSRARDSIRRALRGEEGFGLVEAMAATVVIAVGLIAVLGAFASTEKQTSVAQRQAQAAAIGQRELERLRDRPFDKLALTSIPTSAGGDGLDPGDPSPNNPRNPSFYVNDSGSPIRLRIKQEFRDQTSAALAGTPTAGEPFVTASPSGVAPTFTDSVDGNGVTVHRYVTWRDESCAATLPGNLASRITTNLSRFLLTTANQITGTLLGTKLNLFCADTEDAKRVTVAVVPDRIGNNAGPDRPVWMSTLVYDPDKGLITY